MNGKLFSKSPGREYTVVSIPDELEWLERFGLNAGCRLSLLTRSGCGVTIRLHMIKYALGRGIAEKIIVKAHGADA